MAKKCASINPDTGSHCTRYEHAKDDHWASDDGGTINEEWGIDHPMSQYVQPEK